MLFLGSPGGRPRNLDRVLVPGSPSEPPTGVDFRASSDLWGLNKELFGGRAWLQGALARHLMTTHACSHVQAAIFFLPGPGGVPGRRLTSPCLLQRTKEET
ncbi:unnamed protein product [Lota lota]